MGRMSDLDIERQELEAIGAIAPQRDQEPDLEEIMSYAKAYTKTPEFAREWAKFSQMMENDNG